MPGIAIVFGLLLSALSGVAYLQPELIGTSLVTKAFTALIPAFFGVALILCGVISTLAPDMRKHAMHIAAVVGVLGVIGALARPISKLIQGGTVDLNAAPERSQLIMALLSLIFVILCVRSFIQARKARQAAGVK